MEAQVIRNYLEWIAELPWNTRSVESLDVAKAGTILEEDHYGLNDVKERASLSRRCDSQQDAGATALSCALRNLCLALQPRHPARPLFRSNFLHVFKFV